MIRHPQLKLYHLKSQTLKHIEITIVSESLHMIHHRKVHELEITDSDYQHDRTTSAETIPSQTSNPKTVEIIKRSDKPTYDTSLERPGVADYRC